MLFHNRNDQRRVVTSAYERLVELKLAPLKVELYSIRFGDEREKSLQDGGFCRDYELFGLEELLLVLGGEVLWDLDFELFAEVVDLLSVEVWALVIAHSERCSSDE